MVLGSGNKVHPQNELELRVENSFLTEIADNS